jgi:uncharacterized cupin superfamily protein
LGNGEPGRRRIESVVLAVRTGDVEFAARVEERAHCFMNRGAPVENSAVSVKEKRKERDRKKKRKKKIEKINYVFFNIIGL